MTSSSTPKHRSLIGWIAFAVLFVVGVTFTGTLIHGIIRGNGTAHDLDHGNRQLDEHLLELADMRGTAPVDALPFASADAAWDVVCYVGEGAWVGRTVADRLGLELTSLTFEPRNIYVVEGYWALAFYDVESRLVRIVEVNRKPVREIEGPPCLARAGAVADARPLDDGSGNIVVSLTGTPPLLN